MYRKAYNVSAWSVAMEIAGYWKPGPAQVRVYKDDTLGARPWVAEVVHPTYGNLCSGWERIA